MGQWALWVAPPFSPSTALRSVPGLPDTGLAAPADGEASDDLLAGHTLLPSNPVLPLDDPSVPYAAIEGTDIEALDEYGDLIDDFPVSDERAPPPDEGLGVRSEVPTVPTVRTDATKDHERIEDSFWTHDHVREKALEAGASESRALRLPTAGGGRTVEIVRISGATPGARATTKYTKAYFEARSVVEAALYDETISVRRKEHVRRYFEAIRPKD